MGRLCVVPEWSADASRTRPDDVPLLFEPGGAFGSGRHPTTRMCLRALQAPLAGGRERRSGPVRVLDAGSGSGILAVAARLLGADEALGFDVDPHARRYAAQLAARNGVDACEFRTGGFECLTDRDVDFDGLVANLYSDLLQEHAAALAHKQCHPLPNVPGDHEYRREMVPVLVRRTVRAAVGGDGPVAL